MTRQLPWIELDGSQGEGGGQILRTALTLSMLTGQPLRLVRIRARRSKPGLLRQHLTAVQAAARICGAQVAGDRLGSGELQFVPGTVRGGDYEFAIGTAGSSTLVLQTILPALWFAESPSRVQVTGGTHNPLAPPFDFLQRAWLPLVTAMGAATTLHLDRHGFFPAGGGVVRAEVEPVRALNPIEVLERGALQGLHAEARVAGIPIEVAQRELAQLQTRLELNSAQARELPAQQGPGNVVLVAVESARVSELFCGFGEIRLPAEEVANRVSTAVRRYLRSTAAVAEHLADQLVLPMALAGSGAFTTHVNSSHLQTVIAVIRRFLPVAIDTREVAADCWRVQIQRR